MSLRRWVRSVFGADVIRPPRRSDREDIARARAERALAKAREALERRARLDGEVQRVEKLLRDLQW